MSWVYVVKEGSLVHLSIPDHIDVVLEEVVRQGNPNDTPNTGEEMANFFFYDHGDAGFISRIRAICLGVDDNNKPTPKNIPKPASTVTIEIIG